ncbi:hypothetical protein HY500_03235 [Candidatus Woesearchaeota archaeon]|nr:hypothetical protein [Candidatus Woesearchaeota archaeon]
MQKRNLIIFSFLVVSILFIAGCQEAVGGVRSRRNVQTFPTYTDSVRVNDNVRAAVPNSVVNSKEYAPGTVVTTCPGINIGSPVELRYGDGTNAGCYQIVDCAGGTYNSNPYKSERVYDYTVPVYLPVVKYIEMASQFCQGAQRMSTDWVIITN